jgi:hypothetical protein
MRGCLLLVAGGLAAASEALAPLTVGGAAIRLVAAGSDRHRDAEVSAWELAVDDLHGAAVSGDELEHHGQTDPGAFHRGVLRCAARIEGLEDVFALLAGDAGAAVRDVQHELLSLRQRPQVNGPALGGIFHRIRYEVFQNQPHFAPVRDQGEVRHLHIEADTL